MRGGSDRGAARLGCCSGPAGALCERTAPGRPLSSLQHPYCTAWISTARAACEHDEPPARWPSSLRSQRRTASSSARADGQPLLERVVLLPHLGRHALAELLEELLLAGQLGLPGLGVHVEQLLERRLADLEARQVLRA